MTNTNNTNKTIAELYGVKVKVVSGKFDGSRGTIINYNYGWFLIQCDGMICDFTRHTITVRKKDLRRIEIRAIEKLTKL